MPKVLSKLLGAKEPLFSLSLQQLEKSTGHSGLDLGLLSEVQQRAGAAVHKLGLDPGDTTGPELFHALAAKAREHDAHLAAALGITDAGDRPSIVAAVAGAIKKHSLPETVWAIKPAKIKSLIKSRPPKKLMKLIGYRSVDSLLKHEHPAKIVVTAQAVESHQWYTSLAADYRKLTPGDFESRPVELVFWTPKWANAITAVGKDVVNVRELGAVIVKPKISGPVSGSVLDTLSRILAGLVDNRVHSAFFKLNQVRPDFGDKVHSAVIDDAPVGSIMSGPTIHWRLLHKFYGSRDNSYHPEVFEPHVQAEDLEWRRVEQMLGDIDPELRFWQGLDFVGAIVQNEVVSCNILDVISTCVNDLDFEHRGLEHFRDALWDELYSRYVGVKVIEEQVLSQLDQREITP